MSREVVVKHNEIVEGRYNLTVTEAKIIAKLTSLIKKDDDDLKSYNFTARELLNDLKINENNYKDLKHAIDKLMTRIITIKTEKSELKTTFLSSAEYFKDSTIELSFDKKLKPYFLQLKDNFTKYYLENVLNLKSFYAIRIYELCKQYERIKERVISIEELRIILGIDKTEYKLYGHFKDKVLKISEREINEKTDISIKFEEIKTGRRITAVKFIILAAASSDEKAHKENKPVIITDEVLSLFNLLPESEKIETNKKELAELLKIHSFEMLKADIEYCKSQNITKGFWKYFISSTQRGHYSTKVIEKKKKVTVTQTQFDFDNESKIDYNNLTEAEKKGLEMINKRVLKK